MTSAQGYQTYAGARSNRNTSTARYQNIFDGIVSTRILVTPHAYVLHIDRLLPDFMTSQFWSVSWIFNQLSTTSDLTDIAVPDPVLISQCL